VDAQLEGHARPDRFAGLQHGAELELGYWFRPGPPGSSGNVSQQVDIDYAAVRASNVKARIDSANQSGVATLRLDFAAVTLNPYSSSGDIAVRLHRSDWSTYDQTANFSFRPDAVLTNWDHVGLYRNGQLVWGAAPPTAATAQ
jgi:hypothetical protein